MALGTESRPGFTPLFFLGGPTASGKTSVAHALAERHGLRLLSMDSMMVYRGMDIGTAKPTPAEIQAYGYVGLNLADPGDRFSTGEWLRLVREQLDDRPSLGVGGTGLYLHALTRGLAPGSAPAEPALSEDVETLRDALRALDPSALEKIADPWNPRRLARALDWLQAGHSLPKDWERAPLQVLPVLRWPVPTLDTRIRERAELMMDQGLLQEAERLRTVAGTLPGTAGQAIGYREALDVLDGSLTRAGAVESIALRTRRYAKRQRTWFRNQTDPRWVDMEAVPRKKILAEVEAVWEETGPFWFERRTR